MIKIENIETWGFEHAIRGMRNPKNSWDKSDTVFELILRHGNEHARIETKIGPNDLKLMRSLYSGGPEHRKFMRQIFVSMDITAPLYWWKEMDQYKVGTVTDSCSTMHKIHAKDFTLDDFSHDHLVGEETALDVDDSLGIMNIVISALNALRKWYTEYNDKEYWYQMIQLLPSSYNQRRTMTMNYENVVSMIHQREFHKLDEWREFVKILKDLPYIKEITDNG